MPGDPCCADRPATVTVDITGLSNGPDALARHDGRVVFVPGVAPGDRVRVRFVAEHPRYARAQVTHHCAPGAAYRSPPCPWVSTCGGCPWQHVRYPTQLAAKARNVRDALARLAGITPRRELPVVAAPEEWGYRRRIRLHADAAGRLGYLQPRSHTIVEIETCAIAEPVLSALVPALRAAVARLATRLETVELVSNGRGGAVALLVTRRTFHESDDARIVRLLDAVPALAGVELRGKSWAHHWGDVGVTVSVADGTGTPVRTSSASFTQVNALANHLLVRAVVALARGAAHVLDLFCGTGNLSLPLARAGASVLGVDRDRGAIADAVASAAAAGLPQVRFEVARADRFLRQCGLADADLVVLDPPRTGATAVAIQLGRLRPPRILYVSCDPATLARDARILVGAGYVVDRVQAIDLFPQTAHVETVLEAVRS